MNKVEKNVFMFSLNHHYRLIRTGKQVFWHSTAHIMGEAMELCYGGCLCYGPPIEQGFYYDMYLENRYVSSSSPCSGCVKRENYLQHGLRPRLRSSRKDNETHRHWRATVRTIGNLQGRSLTLVRSKNSVQDHFSEFMSCVFPSSTIRSKFEFSTRKFIHRQQRSIGRLRTDRSLITIDLFRCGPLIDLCRGPHIRNTGKVKAFAVTKVRREREREGRLKRFCRSASEFFDVLGRRSISRDSSTSLWHFLSRPETVERMETSARRSSEKKSPEDWSRTRSLLLSWAESWLVLLLPEGRPYLQQADRISSSE